MTAAGIRVALTRAADNFKANAPAAHRVAGAFFVNPDDAPPPCNAVKDFSGEAATARSRTRQRAERIRNKSFSREAATAERFCGRRFAALAINDGLFCGLTPAATCCRGFAAGPEPQF